jgi:hypothetical protein
VRKVGAGRGQRGTTHATHASPPPCLAPVMGLNTTDNIAQPAGKASARVATSILTADSSSPGAIYPPWVQPEVARPVAPADH